MHHDEVGAGEVPLSPPHGDTGQHYEVTGGGKQEKEPTEGDAQVG